MFYGIPDERIRIFLTRRRVSRSKTAPNAGPIQIAAQLHLLSGAVLEPQESRADPTRILHLKQKYNLRLPVVFTGSDQGNESYIRQLVQTLQLDDQVFFLGHVSRPALRVLYQNAFVLCYPSLFGPLNLPPLEAFALGCPVIADIPGAKQELGDAAMLVNPANEFEIAEALKSVRSDSAKRESLTARGLKCRQFLEP